MKDGNKITHIGHIVDIDLMYDATIIANHSNPSELLNDVRPFVKFAGEKLPRSVHPANLCIFKD